MIPPIRLKAQPPGDRSLSSLANISTVLVRERLENSLRIVEPLDPVDVSALDGAATPETGDALAALPRVKLTDPQMTTSPTCKTSAGHGPIFSFR